MRRDFWIPGLLALALCLPFSALAASPDGWHDAHAQLSEARDRGELDDGTYALYLLYLVRAPERLPESFRPDITKKIPLTEGAVGQSCMTVALKESFQLREKMTPEQAELAAAVGGRPTPCGGCTACGTNTCVHWTQAGMATYANTLLGYMEESWDIEVNQMGWLAPPNDGTAGGNGNYDFYVDNTGFGGAFTAPEFNNPATAWTDATSYVVIDSGLPTQILNTFAAHEFNHSCQFAYDYIEANNIYEASATFMEDAVYDGVNDYLFFIADFQQNPQRAVDFATFNDFYMYGTAVFMKFLSERYDNGGTAFVRDIWDRARQNTDTNNEPDYLDGIHSLVGDAGEGGLQDAYAEFAWWRLFTGANALDGVYFDEGASWPQVPPIASHSLNNEQGLTSFNPPQELGANYAGLQVGGGNGDRLAVQFFGDSATSWAMLLVGRNSDGSTCVANSRSDLTGTAGVFIEDLNDYSRIDLVFANLGSGNPRDPDPQDYSTDSFSYDIAYSTNASDVSIDGMEACGEPPGGDDDDDDAVGCLCSVQSASPSPVRPAGAGILVVLALALGTLGWRRRRP